MKCAKCGSENISVQREQTGTIGGSVHKYTHRPAKAGHGCLYWIFIGWWIWIFKFLFHVCTFGIFLILKKKKAGTTTGMTASASKSINRTVAVCQNCGNSWKV